MLCPRCGGSGKTQGQRRRLTVCKICEGKGQTRDVVQPSNFGSPVLAEERADYNRYWYYEPRRELEEDSTNLLGEPEYAEDQDKD